MVQLTTENIKWLALTAVIAVAAIAVIGTDVLTGLSSDSIEITEASLIKGPTTDVLVSVTIKNLGNAPITAATVSLYDIERVDAGSSSGISDAIPPTTTGTKGEGFKHTPTISTSGIGIGETQSFTTAVSHTDKIKIGDSYPLNVEATLGSGTDTVTLSDTIVVYVTGI